MSKMLFIHIPRTSGMTIVNTFLPKYDTFKLLPAMSPKKVQDKKFYYGHIPFGLENILLPNTKCQYVTFLREPIARWISLFNYTIGKTHSPQSRFYYRTKLWHQAQKDIVKFLKLCLTKGYGSNMMVKQLGGGISDLSICKHKAEAYVWSRRNKSIDLSLYLENAILNLREFDFIGYPSSESHRLFCEKFNLKYVPRKLNTSSQRISIDWEQPSVLELLHALNEYDIKLWETINVD